MNTRERMLRTIAWIQGAFRGLGDAIADIGDWLECRTHAENTLANLELDREAYATDTSDLWIIDRKTRRDFHGK